MAAVNFSPSGGFSYAQAARGQASAKTSQTPSSKVTSGTASPSNGVLSVSTPGSNWADDVESSMKEHSSESQKTQQDHSQSIPAKEPAVERTKSEDKIQNPTSAISSPDLGASSSTGTKEEDSSFAPNGSSSETTWETKSQTSEPAWIADRKERQESTQQPSEKSGKSEKKQKDSNGTPAPKPVTLQEAPPPPVNPWTKMAEDRAKQNAMSRPAVAAAPPATNGSPLKEKQRPRADSRRKANSVSGIPKDGVGNEASESKQQRSAKDDARPGPPRPGSNRSMPYERSSLPNLTNSSTFVKDEQSWPTPDSAQDKERKDAAAKEPDEKRDEEVTPVTKRKKPEWKVMPVVPNVIFDTQKMIDSKGGKSRGTPNGERGGKGGNGSRARGGYRATPNSSNSRDTEMPRASSSPINRDTEQTTNQRGRSHISDREAMPPPPKPTRASSAGPFRERKAGAVSDRTTKASGTIDASTRKPSADASPSIPDSRSNDIGKYSSTGRRTKSPKTGGTPGMEKKDEDFMPKPIPRQSSNGIQTENGVQASESATNDGPPVRMVPTDGRRESRNFENVRDPGAPRGSKRGGRGRGGNGARELTNGHMGNGTYVSNYGPEFTAQSPYGVMQSPYTPRGNHQFTHPASGRGGWSSRGNPRSQSIPIDTNYAQRFGTQYSYGHPQMAPIQTYVPGMFDANGYQPMSATPYSNPMPPHTLMDMIIVQLDYYFSMDNLLKDMFLRRQMDSQGFVFLDVIANFNRIKLLTQDMDLVKAACVNSNTVQIRVGEDGIDRLRRAEGWEQFLLPMDQREENAQTEGPMQLERPEMPQPSISNFQQQYREPASAGVPYAHQQRYDRRSYDSMYASGNAPYPQYASIGGAPEIMYSDMANGEESRGRTARSSIHEDSISPTEQPAAENFESNVFEPDTFPDDHASALTVVVKMSQQRVPYHSLASRTFSNGSIDSRSIQAEMEKPAEPTPRRKVNGESLTNGNELRPTLSRVASPNNARSRERGPGGSGDSEMSVFWMKDNEKPADTLPTDLTSEPYVQLRLKALEQRNQAATGQCPYDLDVLYQFWCHFLIRNFNNRMYTEFKYYANEDAKERHNFNGLQNLVKFYSQALSSHNPIRDRVVQDYVELVRNEPSKLEGAAFKQLRSAWRNGALNLKNRKKLADIVDEKLKEQLDRHEA